MHPAATCPVTHFCKVIRLDKSLSVLALFSSYRNQPYHRVKSISTAPRPTILSLSRFAIIALTLLGACQLSAATFWLDELDLSTTSQGWGTAQNKKSVEGNPLSVGGVKYDHGIGTHAESTINLRLEGGADKFSATVGIDDEVGTSIGTVTFSVVGDGKVLWQSGLMKTGDTSKSFAVNLTGVKTLTLLVGDGGDGIDRDHADWADARFEISGANPEVIKPSREEAVILTPPAPPTPRINGATIFGVRPGSPFLFTVAATGDRPMTFSAKGLPKGLLLDEQTGRITGQLTEAGEYTVTLRAKNSRGHAEERFKIVCGQQIALTPPMGWNSWNCFAGAVSDEKVRAAADAFIKSGLQNHGWTYINIDDYWQTHRDSKDSTLQGPRRDDQGRILPNPRFPDMKALADYVHGLGLKIGLYSSPGPWTCGGCVGSFDHEELDAKQYADWGFDYLKYDWCSYSPNMESQRQQTNDYSKVTLWGAPAPSEVTQLMQPYEVMQAALHQQSRDIVYSLCQYGMGDVWKWGAIVGGNCWRTTGDINDSWGSMSANGFNSAGHEQFAGPSHWNDPDMLVVGKLGWGKLRPTRLTPNEQYTHISLWCLLASPLLIGCDLSQMDDFTLNLLSNDEVIAVDQDPLGRQATRISKMGNLEIWAKDMQDGTKAIGFFNRGETPSMIQVKWADLGLHGRHRVRDLWRQKDIGKFTDSFTAEVARHGVVLVRVW
jgi:alpha-galactosidase